MTRFMRTMVGALLGAIGVLLWNNLSRPYSLYLFTQAANQPVVAKSGWLTENQKVLIRPRTALEASLWADAGAHKIRFSKKPTVADLQNLLEAVQIGSQIEPNNAYWTQMEAVFFSALGNRTKALQRWIAASKKPKWNDHQADRMHKVIEEIEQASGHRSSWPLYALTAFKDDNSAQLLLRLATTIVAGTNLNTAADLRIRFATIANGCLIRDYGSSIPIFRVGADMMELASYPSHMESVPSNKALVLARINLVNRLRDSGLTDEAEYVYRQYQENDARNYYIGSVDAPGHLRQNAIASVLIATVPSCLLGVSILSVFIWIAGGLMLRYPILQRVLTLPYAPVIGVTVAALIYFYLHLSLLALSAAATFAFATFAPNQERRRPSEDLGPFFRFSIIMVGVMLTAILGVFFISLTEASQISNYVIQAPEEFAAGSIAMVVLAIACLGLLVLIAPAWAIVRKLKTPWVFAIGLRDLGKGLFVGTALLSVISSPIAVHLDQSLYAKGNALLDKEPLYYMATNE